MSENNEFTIENEVLVKYTGRGGDVVIPDGVKNIAERVFYAAQRLTGIIIPDGVTSIDERAFSFCFRLKNIKIPDSVTSIGERAFHACIHMTNATIPAGIMRIRQGAFSNCCSLTSITIPSALKRIEPSVFADCSGLRSITIPDGVTSIGEGAFSGCSSLTDIVIPDSVTSIGAWAFYGCSSLSGITIPGSVTSIGEGAFEGCDHLTIIRTADGTEQSEKPFEWLMEKYGYHEDDYEYSENDETLDDVMERIMENGKFDSSLQDFLDTMPHTRESTDELLDAVLEWDLWELYNKLLTDHDDLLTPEEREKLKADYRQLFDLPLPGEEDWDG